MPKWVQGPSPHKILEKYGNRIWTLRTVRDDKQILRIHSGRRKYEESNILRSEFSNTTYKTTSCEFTAEMKRDEVLGWVSDEWKLAYEYP